VKDRATWLIRRAYARSSALLDEGFAGGADGLRGYHFRLLAALENAAPLSQAELGKLTSIDPSDVTATMVELEALGLIERSVDQRDRRRNLVAITRGGLERLEALDALVSEIQERVLEPLSATERAQFLRILRKLGGLPPGG
jgi:MarR family transcriptional regulator, lower aerobic nicotinate degradation pathway regulator